MNARIVIELEPLIPIGRDRFRFGRHVAAILQVLADRFEDGELSAEHVEELFDADTDRVGRIVIERRKP